MNNIIIAVFAAGTLFGTLLGAGACFFGVLLAERSLRLEKEARGK